MTADEQAIRKMIADWMEATKKGDLPKLLSLMADDVLFTTVGQPPFGKMAFAAAFQAGVMTGWKVDASSDIQEIETFGDWGFVRNHITVTMTPLIMGPPPMDKPVVRAGFAMSVVKKLKNGEWVVYRDANMMKPMI